MKKEPAGAGALPPEEAIDRFGNLVYRIAFTHVQVKADADDVFQEVFLLYCRKRPVFEDENHCRCWLVNVTLKISRKIAWGPWRRRTAPLEEYPDLAGVLDDTGLSVFGTVQNLPVKYRVPIYLHYYEGLTVDEIAAATGRRPGTVKSDLFRGRALLRDALKDD